MIRWSRTRLCFLRNIERSSAFAMAVTALALVLVSHHPLTWAARSTPPPVQDTNADINADAPSGVISGRVRAQAALPKKVTSPDVMLRCGNLAGQTIDAAEIGLPTAGADITNAIPIRTGQANNRNGDYCKIVGVIRAKLTTTPNIRFEVNLPSHWNKRALQMGGSGYNGVVVTGTEPTSFAPFASPLFQGYATFGSDSGHNGNSGTASFALNSEAVGNFGSGHLKKTHDVAMALIKLGYGRLPEKTYFAGGSTGGREAFTAIQRFPNDYDGVIANAPAINFSGVRLIGVSLGQAEYSTPGGFVTPAQQKRVFDTVMRECDGLDGVKDGIISNVAACHAREADIIAKLQCGPPASPEFGPSPADDDCLTPAQLKTLEVLRDGLHFTFPLAYGVTTYHGYNVFAGVNTETSLGLGDQPSIVRPLQFSANGYLFAQADGYMKYFVTHDPNFDTLGFDLTKPGQYQDRLVDLSARVGGMNPDMSAFIARGGKFIVMHGLSDEVTSPNETIAYYEGLVSRYGQPRVDSFMRLYMIPGFQHGNGVFIPAWDELGALDKWVSTGVAPETLVGEDIARETNGRTRPLCRYPAYPRYKGKGNVKEASNFSCTLP
jgi:feruloyl esterase